MDLDWNMTLILVRYLTSGEVTEEMIKNYIEHHFEPRIGENFEVEK